MSHLTIFPLELLGSAIGFSADPSSSKGHNQASEMDTNTFHKTRKCNYFGKLFNYVGYMRRHIKLFMKVAKISNVNLVENYFTQADFLRRHKIIHEGQKDFKCNSCGKLFTHVGDMKKHIKTVTMIDLRKLSVIIHQNPS